MGGGVKTPKIYFGKSGTIGLNGMACDHIELKAGEKITLAQDDDDPACWYIFKDPEHGFEVRNGYDKKGVLLNHSVMVKTFVDSFDLQTDTTHSFKIAGEPTIVKGDKTKYWGILVPVS